METVLLLVMVYCLFILACVAFLGGGYYILYGNTTSAETSDVPSPSKLTAELISLPIPLPVESFKKKGIWNIDPGHQRMERAVLKDGAMCVTFPKLTSGSNASGAKFIASPPGFPAVEASVACTISIPSTFLWGSTSFKGKIGLGLYMGRPEGSGGGSWSDDSGRILVVWNAPTADAKEAQAAAYTYLPLQIHKGSLPVVTPPISNPPRDRHLTTSVQHASFFEDVALNEFGNEGIWIFKKGTPLTLQRGKDNRVSLRMRMNTVTPNVLHDGILELTVNDKTRIFDKMVFRTRDTCLVEGIRFGAWYGGAANAGTKFGPSLQTEACYKDFTYRTSID
jgi:hypothetical protein